LFFFSKKLTNDDAKQMCVVGSDFKRLKARFIKHKKKWMAIIDYCGYDEKQNLWAEILSYEI